MIFNILLEKKDYLTAKYTGDEKHDDTAFSVLSISFRNKRWMNLDKADNVLNKRKVKSHIDFILYRIITQKNDYDMIIDVYI